MDYYGSDSDKDCGAIVETYSSSARSTVFRRSDGVVVKRYFTKPMRRELGRQLRKGQTRAGTPGVLGLIMEEVRILKHSASNDNIITIQNFIPSKTSIDLLFDFGGIPILDDQLQRPCEYNTFTMKSIVKQLIGVTQHLHSCLILHCDIKPSNILIDERNVVKLADFGSAIALSTREDIPEGTDLLSFRPKTTPSFTPPEMCAFTTCPLSFHGKPIDVWGLGVSIYCLIYQAHPFKIDGNIMELYRSILNDDIVFPENDVLDVEILKKFLEKAPSNRSDINEISRLLSDE